MIAVWRLMRAVCNEFSRECWFCKGEIFNWILDILDNFFNFSFNKKVYQNETFWRKNHKNLYTNQVESFFVFRHVFNSYLSSMEIFWPLLKPLHPKIFSSKISEYNVNRKPLSPPFLSSPLRKMKIFFKAH